MPIYHIDIKKPMFDNYVYIREETLKKAARYKKDGWKVVVRIPQGEGEIDPLEWYKNGKRMEKVFLRPNEPMVLYGGYVPIPKAKPEKEKPLSEEDQLSMF